MSIPGMVIGNSAITVFENHRNSLIQHCEQSELRLHFEWTKVLKNVKNAKNA